MNEARSPPPLIHLGEGVGAHYQDQQRSRGPHSRPILWLWTTVAAAQTLGRKQPIHSVTPPGLAEYAWRRAYGYHGGEDCEIARAVAEVDRIDNRDRAAPLDLDWMM
jgi:hypothetical protein